MPNYPVYKPKSNRSTLYYKSVNKRYEVTNMEKPANQDNTETDTNTLLRHKGAIEKIAQQFS